MEKRKMKSIIATMALAALPLAGAWAQDAPRGKWYFGLGGATVRRT